jgi:hypothetical protein
MAHRLFAWERSSVINGFRFNDNSAAHGIHESEHNKSNGKGIRAPMGYTYLLQVHSSQSYILPRQTPVHLLHLFAFWAPKFRSLASKPPRHRLSLCTTFPLAWHVSSVCDCQGCSRVNIFDWPINCSAATTEKQHKKLTNLLISYITNYSQTESESKKRRGGWDGGRSSVIKK